VIGVRSRRKACRCASFRAIVTPISISVRCSDPFAHESSHSHRPTGPRDLVAAGAGSAALRYAGCTRARRCATSDGGSHGIPLLPTRRYRRRRRRRRRRRQARRTRGSDCRGCTREIVLAAACARAAARRRRRRIAISKVRVDKNVTRDACDRAPRPIIGPSALTRRDATRVARVNKGVSIFAIDVSSRTPADLPPTAASSVTARMRAPARSKMNSPEPSAVTTS